MPTKKKSKKLDAISLALAVLEHSDYYCLPDPDEPQKIVLDGAYTVEELRAFAVLLEAGYQGEG